MASTTRAAPTGCYKCGRTGHWAQDCKANPISSSARPRGGTGLWSAPGRNAAGGAFVPKYGAGRGGGVDGKEGTASDGPVKEVRKPRKTPKLTPELLLSKAGLGYVLQKMPDIVSIKAREETVVEDLKSLLEGYMHWHSLLLPYYSFEQFVEYVEKLGANKRVHRCVQELRDKIHRRKRSKATRGKGSEANKDLKAESNKQCPSKEAEPGGGLVSEKIPSKDNSDKLKRTVDDDANADYFSEEGEPPVPLDEDDLEDFLRQGVVEPEDTTVPSGGSDLPGSVSEMSPVRKFPSLEDPAESTPVSEKSKGISEAAAARMETNRLTALERARARRANNL